MNSTISINSHTISNNSPAYIVAEMSANHNMDLERAKDIIKAAADAGADAIKLQTYTPDTITIDSHEPCFMTAKGGLWEGMTLYDLYKKAYTPWEWHAELFDCARSEGIDCFSSPFDMTAVDFLQQLDAPAYKIASFEINDIPLIKKVAKTGKPIIISTGIAYLEDIDLAVRACKEEGNEKVILLKCISAYPAPFSEMNLRSIPLIADTFDCISGLSDHTLGSEIAIAAVAMGARVIEKHFTLKRSDGGVDSAFSMEYEELKDMVKQIRNVETALGRASFELNEKQRNAREGSRSLFIVKDIKKGEVFSEKNVRSIRPGNGLHTKYYEEILGKQARNDYKKGTPLSWGCIE